MKYLAILSILVFVAPVFAATFPQPVGFVNDFAGVLTDSSGLEYELAAYEQNTTIEIAVVTISSLPEDQTAATYANELFAEWGIGKSDDNGILVLIIPNGTIGNRLRIELGYGIQGYITGAESGRILDAAFPYYAKGDYQTAVEIILYGLSDQLVNYVPGSAQGSGAMWGEEADWTFWIPIGFFFFIIIISAVMHNRCPYCFGKLKCSGDTCTCTKCGRKIKRGRRYAPILVGGGGFGGGGGGGFGGGGSGGGGAGR